MIASASTVVSILTAPTSIWANSESLPDHPARSKIDGP